LGWDAPQPATGSPAWCRASAVDPCLIWPQSSAIEGSAEAVLIVQFTAGDMTPVKASWSLVL
jgi:hypothetical protein